LKGGEKMVKKRRAKEEVEGEGQCRMYKNHCCEVFLVKITTIAFLLFLMTVWNGLGVALLSVHWGIYLGITLILMIFAMNKMCKKK
jgi:hypothetical protein